MNKLPRKKIVLVGDGAAGKTSLIYRLKTGAIPETHVPTIMENSTTMVEVLEEGTRKQLLEKDGSKVKMEISVWDTAGQEDYDRLRPLSYPNTDCVILLCSVDEPESLFNVEAKWAKEIAHYCRGVPVVLVANKSDLFDDLGLRSRMEREGISLVDHEQLKTVQRRIGAKDSLLTSAKDGTNVTELFGLAAGISLKHNRNRRKRRCTIV